MNSSWNKSIYKFSKIYSRMRKATVPLLIALVLSFFSCTPARKPEDRDLRGFIDSSRSLLLSYRLCDGGIQFALDIDGDGKRDVLTFYRVIPFDEEDVNIGELNKDHHVEYQWDFFFEKPRPEYSPRRDYTAGLLR
jgi:hypothetical protein